jgi:uncharacterized protein
MDVIHEFSYPLALAYVDLEELPSLLAGGMLSGRRSAMRFRRTDYLGDPETPLAEAVRLRVESETGSRPTGPVRLLAQLRSFGHCFNPVSLYYCLDRDGETLAAVLAEVTNTPWKERHSYVLDGAAGAGVGKRLHVSPFMAMDHSYEWRLPLPGPTLSAHIASWRGEALAFDATLKMTRSALTAKGLNRIAARYPGGTVRTLALIYAQALRLRMKGAVVHPHPAVSQRWARRG